MNRGKNVFGEDLVDCCTEPMTGFFRDGCCRTGPGDLGLHILCAEMTEEFLAFSRAAGNDLSAPVPEYRFPGLKPGRPLVFVRATLGRSTQRRRCPACFPFGHAHLHTRICRYGRPHRTRAGRLTTLRFALCISQGVYPCPICKSPGVAGAKPNSPSP